METFSIVNKVCTVYTKHISQKVSMVLRLHTFYDPNKIDTAQLRKNPKKKTRNRKLKKEMERKTGRKNLCIFEKTVIEK